MNTNEHEKGLKPFVPIRVRWWLEILGVLGVLAIPCSAAESLRVGDIKFSDAVQDTTGVVWAIGHPASGYNVFLRWEGRNWRKVEFKAAGTARPHVLARGVGGAVLCLWQVNETNWLLSQHKGPYSRLLARWKWRLSWPFTITTVGKDIWITSDGKDILRLGAGGTVTRAYSIAARQMQSGREPARAIGDRNALQVVGDGQGRTWFWSDALSEGLNRLSLRGVLIFDGKKWVHHPRLSGVPDKPYTALVLKDVRHFWLAVGDYGLYELDSVTRRARRIRDPAPTAFFCVQKIARLGPDWYLVAESPEVRYPDGDLSLRNGDLWRLSGTASAPDKWQKLLSGLDWTDTITGRANRALISTPSGLWLGALAGGVWFVPRDGAPVRIDWRRGFFFAAVHRLFRLRDGRVMALDLSYHGGTVADLAQYLAVKPDLKIETFNTYGNMAQDSGGRLWCVRSLRDNAVREWDGRQWLRHPVPAGFTLSHLFYLSPDASGRVWLLPDQRDDETAIYDPARDSWQVFPTYAAALQSQLSKLGPQRAALLRLGGRDYLTPRFSSDGRICYRSVSEKIYFFNGEIWRKWSRKQIKHTSKPNETEFDGAPFFNHAGKLCVNIDRDSWEWLPSRGWHTIKYEEDPGTGGSGQPESPLTTPSVCQVQNPESLQRDKAGALWLTSKQQLYKAMFDLCAPQFSPSERHPFRDGRSLHDVYSDGYGNQFMRTSSGGEEYVLLRPRQPLPQTQLKLTPLSVDTFTLDFATSVRGQRWFRWRLDDGAWSTPAAATRVLLDALPGGRHRFEAVAIDSRLQIDPTPAVVSFTVTVDPAQQIAGFIAALGAEDYKRREAAVAALARQPARALPALRAARAAADADGRWWIDAAIQAAEESTRKNKGTGLTQNATK
ncbi:MAG TPA: hypothetical protein VNA16_06620 [Abditibacteriaceae bacterium]|nr:hypothetical protein [Abditibacteriaceae bacterium]